MYDERAFFGVVAVVVFVSRAVVSRLAVVWNVIDLRATFPETNDRLKGLCRILCI